MRAAELDVPCLRASPRRTVRILLSFSSARYEVHGVVRRTSLLKRSRIDHLKHVPLAVRDPSGLHLHYGDLIDAGSLQRLVRGHQADRGLQPRGPAVPELASRQDLPSRLPGSCPNARVDATHCQPRAVLLDLATPQTGRVEGACSFAVPGWVRPAKRRRDERASLHGALNMSRGLALTHLVSNLEANGLDGQGLGATGDLWFANAQVVPPEMAIQRAQAVSLDEEVVRGGGSVDMVTMACEGSEDDIVVRWTAAAWAGVRAALCELDPAPFGAKARLLGRLHVLGFREQWREDYDETAMACLGRT